MGHVTWARAHESGCTHGRREVAKEVGEVAGTEGRNNGEAGAGEGGEEGERAEVHCW